MTPAERKARSRAGKRVHDIVMSPDTAKRFDVMCERLAMTPSALVRFLVVSHPLPRKRRKQKG